MDSRNQFELIESMPGGVAGINVMVDQLKAAGVNVLWPYNPWDQGTDGGSDNRTQAGIDDAARLSDMLKQTDVRQLQQRFGPSLTHSPTLYHPTHAV